MNLLASLRSRFSSDESDENLGPAAIVEAIYQRSMTHEPTVASLGEPRLEEFGGEFSNDYKVLIPVVLNGKYDIPDLQFPLPVDLDEDAQLYEFLQSYGIEDVADLDEVGGNEIGVEWSNGAPIPTWT